MHENTINKFKDIFEKFENLQSEKEVGFWDIGTNFLLHIRRFGYLMDEINENFNINDTSNIDYINIIPMEVKIAGKESRFYFKIEYSLVNDFQKEMNLSFNRNKVTFINIEIDEVDKMKCWTSVRDMLRIWTSMGFISPENNSGPGETYNIISFQINKIDELGAIKLIGNIANKNWDNNSNKTNSIRDIAFSVVFTGFFLEGNILNYELLEKSLNGHCIKFRKRGKDSRYRKGNLKSYTFEEFVKRWEKDTSSLRKQKWNKNISQEMFSILKEILSLIHNKAIYGWETSKDSFESSIILSQVKASRAGQSLYRSMMANSFKRWSDGSEYERHDIIKGVTSLKLVEAAHILDHSRCGIEEIYDPENGLLIDPTLHRWFDKDLITFDAEGNMYLSKKHKEEIKKVLKNDLEYRIRENILTDKTKEYIRNRNEIHGINLNDFEIFSKY